MYRIKLPINFDGVRYGMTFLKGEGETDSDYIANRMREKGFEVTEVAPEPAPRSRKPKAEREGDNGV